MTSYPNTHPTLTVPSAPTATDLTDLDFGPAADDTVVVPITKEAQLKWLNGAATDQQTMAIGWHLESGINPLIDETLQGMGMQRYVVEHRTADKDGNTQKAYWRVHPCSLIVVAEGVLSTYQMRATDQRTGIAYAQEIELDDKGAPKRYDDGNRNIKKHKVLKLRVYVQEMVQHGYRDWLPLRLTGNIVESMIEALTRQFDVLKAFEDYTGRKAPFYGFSLPLVAATTRKMVGPKEGQQSPIYPMLAQVPTTIGKEYLLQHVTPNDLVQYIREDLLSETLQWSVQESERIAQRGVPEGEALGAPASSASRQLTGMPADPLVQKAQIDWIVTQYCGGNQGVVQAICEHFGVQQVEHVRMSQFQELVQAKQRAQKGANGQTTQG